VVVFGIAVARQPHAEQIERVIEQHGRQRTHSADNDKRERTVPGDHERARRRHNNRSGGLSDRIRDAGECAERQYVAEGSRGRPLRLRDQNADAGDGSEDQNMTVDAARENRRNRRQRKACGHEPLLGFGEF